MTSQTYSIASTEAPGTSSTPISEKLIDRLFEIILQRWGPQKFASMWGDMTVEAVKGVWAEELMGFSREELTKGATAMKASASEWPPAVSEFQGWCRPWMRPETGLNEAVKQMMARQKGEDVWITPILYWTALRVGEFEMRTKPQKDLLSRWTEAFYETMSSPDAHSTPVPPAKIDAPALPPPTTASEEERKANPHYLDFLTVVEELKRKGPSQATLDGRAAGWIHVGSLVL